MKLNLRNFGSRAAESRHLQVVAPDLCRASRYRAPGRKRRGRPPSASPPLRQITRGQQARRPYLNLRNLAVPCLRGPFVLQGEKPCPDAEAPSRRLYSAGSRAYAPARVRLSLTVASSTLANSVSRKAGAREHGLPRETAGTPPAAIFD
jgi:hypothetical protein